MEHTMELLLRVKKGDEEAGEQLVRENLGLVGSVVKRFENRGYEREDLFQIGVIGLMKAIEKFDFSYEVRFSTYAVPLVSGEIRRFLRDDGLVKVSRSIKESGWRIRRSRERLEQQLGRSVTLQELAEDTGLSMEETALALDASEEVASLYQTVYQSDGSELYLVDRIADHEPQAVGHDAGTGQQGGEKNIVKAARTLRKTVNHAVGYAMIKTNEQYARK